MAFPLQCPQLLSAKKLPSAQDWQDHQYHIKELYLVENKTLKEVMYAMEKEYGFKATIKMYKSRITKWGLDQKYKKRDASSSRFANDQGVTAHNDTGTSPVRVSTTSLDDQPSMARGLNGPSDPPIQSIAGFSYDIFIPHATESSEPASPNTQMSQSAEATDQDSNPGPPALTPSVQPPAIRETSTDFQYFEREVVLYFRTSFCSGLWVSDGQDRPYHSTKDLRPNMTWNMLSTFKYALLAACDVAGFGHGGHLNRRSEITDIVVSERPEVIVELLELSLKLIKRKRYDLVRVVLLEFSNVSTMLATKGRKVFCLLAQFAISDSRSFQLAASKAWRLIVDQFTAYLGVLHVTALRYHLGWLAYFASSSVCDQYICLTVCEHEQYVERLFRDLLEGCKARPSKWKQMEMVLIALLDFLLSRRSYSKVEDIVEESLSDLDMFDMTSIQYVRLKALSLASYNQGKVEKAEEYLRKLVNISMITWGSDDPKTIRSILKLERCLTKQGKSQQQIEAVGKAVILSAVDFGWAGF